MHFALLVCLALPADSDAGDTKVVVIVEGAAEIREDGAVVGTVPRGQTLMVHRTDETAYWLAVPGGEAWLSKEDALPLEQGVDHFTEEIRRKPTAEDYAHRAGIRYEMGRFDEAIADLDEALKLDRTAMTLFRRGLAVAGRGDLRRADEDFTAALALDPRFVPGYVGRGFSRERQGRYAEAADDYAAALRVDPRDVVGLNNFAWLLATCPDDRIRDGRTAVRHAEAAYRLGGRDHRHLGTLAAAYAEAGEFGKAVERQRQATEAAPEPDKDRYRSRLALYEKGQPFRQQPDAGRDTPPGY